jgi:uncharacterized membrane protein YcfT
MPGETPEPSLGARLRVDWVDYAKGLCIILVVMMHSTLGVERAMGEESWLHGFIVWARPFRMPDFFLISGLFLSRVVDRPWRDYLDRKVLHFAYFFVLWTLIQGATKLLIAGDDAGAILRELALSPIEPFGTLWFIYLLPIFFVVTKLTRPAPPPLVLAGAALLHMASIQTGWTVIDDFAGRFVYFFAGYALAPRIFDFAALVRRNSARAVPALLLWGLANALCVSRGWSTRPGLSLLLGFAGAAAVVALSALLAKTGGLRALPALGRQSLAIYLAFFLPMAATRILLVGTGFLSDPGAIALLVTVAAVTVPTFVKHTCHGTMFEFLFERPPPFRLRPARAP